MSNKKDILFNRIVLGGTFDRMHEGHKLLFNIAFSVCQEVTIGLTTKYYLSKYPKSVKPERIFSYRKRKENLIILFNKNNWSNYRIVPIRHPYGVAHSENFDAKLKETITAERFLEIREDTLKGIGSYLYREYLGFINRNAITIVFWKGIFDKTQDEILIKMIIIEKNGEYFIAGLSYQ